MKSVQIQSVRRRVRRLSWLLLVATVGGVAVAATPEELSLFQRTNQARAQQGLTPLQWDDALAGAARAHAALVVHYRQLAHRYPSEDDLAARVAQTGAHFQAVAENIAMGPSVESIQRQWMESQPHRANILDPNLNAIGFAVVRRGDFLYAVADFDRSVPGLTYDEVEQAVGKLLAERGIQPTGPREDARQTCEMTHGAAGGSNPSFIMRWQNSDLTQLPSVLEERLASGQYKTASVGACPSANAQLGFTTYRVAVLLY